MDPQGAPLIEPFGLWTRISVKLAPQEEKQLVDIVVTVLGMSILVSPPHH